MRIGEREKERAREIMLGVRERVSAFMSEKRRRRNSELKPVGGYVNYSHVFLFFFVVFSKGKI